MVADGGRRQERRGRVGGEELEGEIGGEYGGALLSDF